MPTATGKKARYAAITATEYWLSHSNAPISIWAPQRRTSGAIAISGTVWLSTTQGRIAGLGQPEPLHQQRQQRDRR